MKIKGIHRTAAMGLAGLLTTAPAAETPVPPAPNGIAFPQGYEDWQVIAPSQRLDKQHVRVILGNDVAIEAARSGKTNPWPEGAVLAKLAWNQKPHEKWLEAIVPGELSHVEFMIKDSSKFADTGGWGFARWVGMELKPHGDDASFVQECFSCHTGVKDSDYVFTRLAPLPRPGR